MWLGRLWAHLRGRRYGDWMWCASGQHFYPLDPRADEVQIEDVARGLANECRYAGHVCGDRGNFYSVAEHSVIVSVACQRLALHRGWTLEEARQVALEGLLHDGEESFIGDMIRPLKYERAMKNFRKAGALVQRAIEKAFNLHPTRASRKLVAEVDNRILTDEIAQVINGADMVAIRAKYGEPLGVRIACLPPAQAEHVFLTRYLELCGLDAGMRRGARA